MWRHLARRDWRLVRRLLAIGELKDAGFHLHQALEKFLKAFLSEHGQPVPTTHELPALLALAERQIHSLLRFRSLCERISWYYLLRLPTRAPVLDENEVRQTLNDSRPLIRALFPDEPAVR